MHEKFLYDLIKCFGPLSGSLQIRVFRTVAVLIHKYGPAFKKPLFHTLAEMFLISMILDIF